MCYTFPDISRRTIFNEVKSWELFKETHKVVYF